MQKLFFAVSIAAVGLFSTLALASDLPTKAPVYKTPIAAPPYNWSGFYVGANFGGGWSNRSLNIPDNNLYGGLTEFIGGVQAGYNFQADHLLFSKKAPARRASTDPSGCLLRLRRTVPDSRTPVYQQMFLELRSQHQQARRMRALRVPGQ